MEGKKHDVSSKDAENPTLHRGHCPRAELWWSVAMPSWARAEAPGSLCVLQIAADGEVLGVLTNKPKNFDVVAIVPKDKSTNILMPCAGLGT